MLFLMPIGRMWGGRDTVGKHSFPVSDRLLFDAALQDERSAWPVRLPARKVHRTLM